MSVEHIFRTRATIIDRLVDFDPKSKTEVKPFRTFGRDELKESIRLNIEWILYTRSSLSSELFDKSELTVIDYGVPDFGSYFTINEADQKRLIEKLEIIIAAFESRISDVKIKMRQKGGDKPEKAFNIVIDAKMIINNVREAISFITVMNSEKNGSVQIRDNTD